MSKKLQGNGMWESSRMMLPEHKEAIKLLDRERDRRARPVMDDQAFEEISRIIQEAIETGRWVRIVVYDPYQNIKVMGQVQVIDPYEQRLRLAHDNKKTWIPFSDILSVE